MAGRCGEGRRASGLAVVGLLAGLLVGASTSLAAQEVGPDPSWESAPPDLGVVGGVMSYDLGEQGSDATGFGGIRVHFPLSSWILLEPAVALARYEADEVEEDVDAEVTLLTTEFQLQLQLPLSAVRPYLGVGAGGMLDLRGERGDDEFLLSTFSLAGGVAVPLGDRWIVRGEVRGRTIDQTHSAVEVGLGLSRHF
jgi:hypothetical protein